MKSKYLYPLKSRYLIISKIYVSHYPISPEFKYHSFTNVCYILKYLPFIFIYDEGSSDEM